MKYLQNVPIHKDDLFFIPAGTIHAIGAGALVAEIQESSNLTYRLYDYDRMDPKTGKPRKMHVKEVYENVTIISCFPGRGGAETAAAGSEVPSGDGIGAVDTLQIF